MPDLTLESLAARVAELERKLAADNGATPATRDWRSVVGISEETEFSRQMQTEIEANSEAERRVAALTATPELTDNPMWDRFLEAIRENRERMDREDAERLAAEDVVPIFYPAAGSTS